MKEIITILGISLYFIAMLACFEIARFIYKDKKGDYLAGGSAETAIMILVAFLLIVNAICVCYCLRNAIVKAQGVWYLITLEGRMQFISRCLSDITFEQAYKLLKQKSEV